MTFTYVTITHTYGTAEDVSAAGTVDFTPITPMHNGITVVQKTVTATLSGTGVLVQLLAANTDPETVPTGTVYEVTERITGQTPLTYYVQVPHDGGTSIDLRSLAGWVGGTGTGSGVLTINSEGPDISGNVVLSSADVGAQPADGDLTGLAGLADGIPRRASGTWGLVTGTPDGTKFLRDDGTWASASGSTYTDEQVRDVIGTALVAGSNVTLTVNDSGDTITIDAATSGSAGIPASTVDAKGDLIAGTANDTVTRRSVGTNGQALLADSAQTTGLAWGAPAPAAHNHAATEITSGTVATARLGSGTASGTTFLRGDQTWATPVGGGSGPVGLYDPESYGASTGGTGAANATAFASCITAAKAANGIMWLRPNGVYAIAGGLTWSTAGDQIVQIEGNNATLNFTVSSQDCLTLGTLDASGNTLSTGGYVRRLKVIRGTAEDSNAFAPVDRKAGIVWLSTRHARTEDCYVNNTDIGFDLRGNCYGSKFLGCRVGVTSNVGLLLRGGTGAVAGSGSDIEIRGFWGGGAKAAFWMEGNAGGYWFYGCKPGGGHHQYTNAKDHYGIFLVGPTYDPVTTVNGAVSAGASTITVADGTTLTGGSCLIGGPNLNDTVQEIWISSKSGNVLTVPTSGTGRVISSISSGAEVRNIGGGVANMAAYGGGIEGTTRIHAVRLYQDCSDIAFSDFSFNSNGPTDGAQGNQMIQVLKHTRGGSPKISFRRCLVQGAWIGTTPLTVGQNQSFSPVIFEEGSAHGIGNAPTFNSVSMDLHAKTICEWSNASGAVAISRSTIFLDGGILANVSGALKWTGWASTTTTIAPS